MAIPEPVLATLFGHEAVHTLDGAAHRARKSLFLPLPSPAGSPRLVDHVNAAWDDAVPAWGRRGSVVLFDEAGTVLTTGVHRWAGMPAHTEAEAAATARDLIAMVDGFATAARVICGPGVPAPVRRSGWAAWCGTYAPVRSPPTRNPVLGLVCLHRANDRPLDEKTAAVELLNVLRPTAAVAWFAAFTAHALHRWPEHRAPLADGDLPFTAAFAHEVRRFYPFVPFLGGLAARDLYWRGEWVPPGDWWCSTCTGRTTTSRSGAIRTPSARDASCNGPCNATS